MADAAYNMYLFVEGVQSGWIKGEAKDVVHPNEIEVTSFGMGVSNDARSSASEDWKPDFADITMTVLHGRASGQLWQAAASGAKLKRIVLSMRKTGSMKSGPANGDYFQIAWHKCLLVGYGLNSGDPLSDTITFTYQSYEMFYAQQKHDGSLGDTVQRNWHVGENKDMAAVCLPFKNPSAK